MNAKDYGFWLASYSLGYIAGHSIGTFWGWVQTISITAICSIIISIAWPMIIKKTDEPKYK